MVMIAWILKMKTSINLPDKLVERVQTYNRKHQDQPISVSGVARQALEIKLQEVEGFVS